MSNDLGLETSVPDWLIEHPELYQHFKEWGLDFSCGGKSLETACREQHLNPAVVLENIEAILRQSA